jgi:hypothetical protein
LRILFCKHSIFTHTYFIHIYSGEPPEEAVIDDEMEKRKKNDTYNFQVDYTSSITVDQIEAINKLASDIGRHK